MKHDRHEIWTSAEVSRLVTLLTGEREYLEEIFNALEFPVAVISADLIVQVANAAFRDALGGKDDSPVGKPLAAFTPDRRLVVKVIDALESGTAAAKFGAVDFRLTRLPGRDEILIAAAPSPAHRVPEPVEPRSAPALSADERFTERMAAVSKLAGGLSHELNNILTVITSYSHLAIERLAGAGVSTDEIDAILKAASDATEIGAALVAIGRRRVTNDAIADLSAVVTRIEPRLREICGDTVQLTLATEPRLPAVQSDPKELERAILALATHSREALGETGGAIAIRVARNSAAGGLTLTVTDDRKWPPAAVGPQMFEPYAAFPNIKKSTRLDLTVAYSILRQARADVIAEVTSDGLTRVSARFPVEALTPGLEANPERSGKILLVDDNAEIRNAIRQTLEHQSYGVLTVATPNEALQACTEASVDLLVSDVDMPDMSGPELVRRVRRIRPTIKVVMMSGFANEEIDTAELTREQIIFLQKPFSPDRLLHAIRTLLPTNN